jgi:hypothetical protein
MLRCWRRRGHRSRGIERLAKGVFEVVTPKLEDEEVKYQNPLAVDLLPFRGPTPYGRPMVRIAALSAVAAFVLP